VVSTGRIQKIKENDIYVEVFDKESPEESSSCSSGGCSSCSHEVKKRLVKVMNPKEITVECGNIIELSTSTSRILLAFLRVLLIPLFLFAGSYYFTGSYFNSSEGFKIIAGSSALVLGILANFLFNRKRNVKEFPEIVRII
jgi:hypothetical protein